MIAPGLGERILDFLVHLATTVCRESDGYGCLLLNLLEPLRETLSVWVAEQ